MYDPMFYESIAHSIVKERVAEAERQRMANELLNQRAARPIHQPRKTMIVVLSTVNRGFVRALRAVPVWSSS
jgi:hypothetical protein